MLTAAIQDRVRDRPFGKGVTDAMLAGAPHQIDRVTLVVHDLDRIVEFYTKAIGLSVLDRTGDDARLGVDSVTLVALLRDPAARRVTPQDAGLFHTAFLLPDRADLSAWLRHTASLRVPLAGASDHLVSEALYLADPEGNGIEVYVDRPSSVWSRGADGIAMATERLDLPALAAASDRPWLGFPAGGRIGHVHLQVGDLPSAEAFYGGVLGFDVMCRYPGATFFGSGGYHHQLAANVWNSRGVGPRTDATTGLAGVEMVTAPQWIEAARARAASDTIRADAPTRLDMVDPWGTPISLVAKAGRSLCRRACSETDRRLSADSVEKLGCCSDCDEVIHSCRETEIEADDGTSASRAGCPVLRV
ncbi:VOC family protein, partial [Methylobacterium sp. A54F]